MIDETARKLCKAWCESHSAPTELDRRLLAEESVWKYKKEHFIAMAEAIVPHQAS